MCLVVCLYNENRFKAIQPVVATVVVLCTWMVAFCQLLALMIVVYCIVSSHLSCAPVELCDKPANTTKCTKSSGHGLGRKECMCIINITRLDISQISSYME